MPTRSKLSRFSTLKVPYLADKGGYGDWRIQKVSEQYNKRVCSRTIHPRAYGQLKGCGAPVLTTDNSSSNCRLLPANSRYFLTMHPFGHKVCL